MKKNTNLLGQQKNIKSIIRVGRTCYKMNIFMVFKMESVFSRVIEAIFPRRGEGWACTLGKLTDTL